MIDAYTQAVSGLNDQTMSIFDDAPGRKGSGGNAEDGTRFEYDAQELSLNRTDEEILRESRSRESAYRMYLSEHDIKRRQERNNKAWKGSKKTKDNKMFEATETFIPIAIKSTPEPMVTDGKSQTEDSMQLSDTLLAIAKRNHPTLRSVLRKMTRHWLIYFIGMAKVTYDPSTGAKQASVVHPKDLILDPAAMCDAGHYDGKWIAERRYDTIGDLMERFPDKKQELKDKANLESRGIDSKITYYEWWTEDSLIFIYDEIVLAKQVNPHAQEGYFRYGKIPYVALTVFNDLSTPHDSTGLIEQTIPLQDTVDKRVLQIDSNADLMNNAFILNGKYIKKENAPEVTTALKKGINIYIEGGHENTQNAISHVDIPALPALVENNLNDSRSELRNVFGVTGSTAEGVNGQDTVRGKVLASQADSSRIGGGVTTEIELSAQAIYEWWLHFMVIYEQVQVPEGYFVEVKEGSLTPKDPLTKRNEAIDLWSSGAIDPITLMKRLDSPNPEEDAMSMFVWQQVKEGKLDPTFYFPQWAKIAQMQQQQLAQQQALQPQMGAPQGQPQGQPPQGGDVQAPQGESAPQYPQEGVEQQSRDLIRSVKI